MLMTLYVFLMIGTFLFFVWLLDRITAYTDARWKRPAKIKQIKGVKPDPAMTKEIRKGLIPYGSKLPQPEAGEEAPRARYVKCGNCPDGFALVRGRFEGKYEIGVAAFCLKCKQWTTAPRTSEDNQRDYFEHMKLKVALQDEQKKYENRKNPGPVGESLPFG